MFLGWRPVRAAVGALLAHSLAADGLRLKKGHKITLDDVARLAASGIDRLYVAEVGPEEIPENEAAQRLAHQLAGPMLRAGTAGTGRCNIYADRDGLLIFEPELVHRFNSVDEAITLATLPPFETVGARQIAATVKIIPFAVSQAAFNRCLGEARWAALRMAPFRPLRVALLQTKLPGLKAELLKKTVEVTRARVGAIGSDLVEHAVCDHDVTSVASQIARLCAARSSADDVVLILGASAIIDRRDVIPAAIRQTGGEIVHFGMPVDPGNLTLLARLGPVHVLGVPGSARSPRLHGSDYVLRRIAAGLQVSAADIMRMGVGGLLKEPANRPMPRARAAPAPAAQPQIAAIILAAGRSTRMGGPNKLLAEIEGMPMVRRVVAAVCAAKLSQIVVVTGHEQEKVQSALQGLPLRFVHNPAFAKGLSTSLKTGIRSLVETVDAALVCLGDMPALSPTLITRLIAAFRPGSDGDIVVPVREGQRGNPVLIGRRHFASLLRLTGDVGAREVIRKRAKAVIEIEVDDDGAFLDLDTPQALAEYRAGSAGSSRGSQ